MNEKQFSFKESSSEFCEGIGVLCMAVFMVPIAIVYVCFSLWPAWLVGFAVAYYFR